MSMALKRQIPGAALWAARFFAVTLLLLAGLPGLTLAAPAAAAEPTALTNVALSVYPEYDNPRLLVMLDGYLPQSTQLPATVRFLVPRGVEMNSAGFWNAQGKYSRGDNLQLGKPSSIEGWDEVSFDTPTNHIRVEYYHDNIVGLPNKNIAYEFRTLYPIDTLEVEIQQPAKATDFTVTPAAQTKGKSENMVTHLYRFTSVGVDKPISFNIAYTKADSVPSLKAGSGPNLLFIFVLVGLAVVVGGAFWFNSRRRRYRVAPRRRGVGVGQRSGTTTSRAAASRSTPMAPKRPIAGQQGTRVPTQPEGRVSRRAGFCPKCGARLGANSRFCPKCGAQNG